MSLRYRPDVDGLRAIAVLVVVFFHFRLGSFDGGFVGVDIFFVISGYLITGIIVDELRRSEFSVASFYARRIRRIFPALAVVSLATLLSGYFFLLPADFASLGEQTAYAIFGLSNFYFYNHSGYFDRAAEMLPMLHTWSLGVEEQFYLFWPALLIAGFRLKQLGTRGVVTLLTVVAFCSFIASIYFVYADEKFAFFMLPTRAWELAVGGLLVFAPIIRGHAVARALNAIGLVLIGYAVFGLSEDSPFPGLNALAPVLGAAFIIWPKEHVGPIVRTLSSRPFVFVGLISYSLYLWHWPVAVYFRIYNFGRPPHLDEALALIVLSFVLAVLSWAFVEKPFRRVAVEKRPFIRYGLVAASGIAVLGLGVTAVGGAPWRLSEREAQLASFLEYKTDFGKRVCAISSNSKPSKYKCIGSAREQPNVLIFGDSHAQHFVKSLAEAYPSVYFTQLASTNCPPLIGTKGKKACTDFVTNALQNIIPTKSFDAIIISSRWRIYDNSKLEKTISYLKQHTPRVIVFGQTMEYTADVPSILLRSNLLRRSISLREAAANFERFAQLNDQLMKRLARLGVEFYSPAQAICPQGNCALLTLDGTPYQWDNAHLTSRGAMEVLSAFKAQGLRLR